MPRTAGHAAGEAALFDTVEGALEIGIEWLTAFTFSTENWSRSDEEVEFLMWFNEDLLTRRRDDLHAHGVSGCSLPVTWTTPESRIGIASTWPRRAEMTAANTSLNLVFAFNYGSRREIVDATQILASTRWRRRRLQSRGHRRDDAGRLAVHARTCPMST